MANSRIVDADCHILEPPDIWKNHLGSKWQEKAPKLVKDPEGGDAWLTAVGGDPDPIGLVSTPGMPFDKFRWLGVTYDEARQRDSGQLSPRGAAKATAQGVAVARASNRGRCDPSGVASRGPAFEGRRRI